LSGTSTLEDGRSLVAFVELDPTVHPFYLGTQAHPEFTSRPTRAHTLFAGLTAAAVGRQKSTRVLEGLPETAGNAPRAASSPVAPSAAASAPAAPAGIEDIMDTGGKEHA